MFSEQEEKFLNRLTKFEWKQTKPLSKEYLSEMASQLRELSNHFGVQLDETTQLTYLEKLRDLPIVKIKIACDSAIKTLKKMPLVAHLRELANEKGTDAIYGLDKPEAKNFHTQKPVLDCIHPIAREISKELVGRDYDDLDPHNPQDNLLVRQVFSEANTIRYIRMGMCGKWLEPTPWQSKVAARNPHIYSTTNRK